MNRTLPSLIMAAVLYIISGFIPSATALHTVMSNILAIPALIFQFAIPALMLTIAIAGRKREMRGDTPENEDKGGGEDDDA